MRRDVLALGALALIYAAFVLPALHVRAERRRKGEK